MILTLLRYCELTEGTNVHTTAGEAECMSVPRTISGQCKTKQKGPTYLYRVKNVKVMLSLLMSDCQRQSTCTRKPGGSMKRPIPIKWFAWFEGKSVRW